MKAVILAGGLGTRLRPFTEVIPKPLLPVGEQSLMEVQIQNLKRAGVQTIYVATNYKSDFVESFLGDGSKYGLDLIFSCEPEPLGTCGPLSLLREHLDEPFLLMNGDILTKLNFKSLYDTGMASESNLTVGTKVIVTPFRFGNVQIDENDHIVALEEKPELALEILAGIYFMRPAILDRIPDGEYYGMDSLITGMLSDKEPISRFLIKDYWLDIGQVEDYSQAREEFDEHFKDQPAS